MGIYFNKMNRRAILRQMGFALALPFLESLIPHSNKIARAAGIPQNDNFVGCFFPLGVHRNNDDGRIEGHKIYTQGDHWAYNKLLSKFKGNLASESLILNGAFLNATAHAGSTGFLAGHHNIYGDRYAGMGPSIDRIIAKQSPRKSILGGVVLGWEKGIAYDGRISLYHETTSWENSTTPIAPMRSPRQLFDFLFSRNHDLETLSVKEQQVVNHQQKSLLDFILNDIKDVRAKVSSSDKLSLDQFTNQFREIEKSIGEPPAAPSCNKPARPGSATLALTPHWNLMNQLTALGFQCGLIHSASMIYSAPVAYGDTLRRRNVTITKGNNFPHETVYHGIGHSSTQLEIFALNRASIIAAHDAFATEYINIFHSLATQLKANGTLPKTTMLLGSGCTNGGHSTHNVPTLMVSGNPGVKSGLIGTRTATKPLNGVLCDILNMHGINVAKFGQANYKGADRRGSRGQWGIY